MAQLALNSRVESDREAVSVCDEIIFDNHEFEAWVAVLGFEFEIALASGFEVQPDRLNVKQATHNSRSWIRFTTRPRAATD